MYISELSASGFRCFGPKNPLLLNLQRGMNILVGPNDSGKTAVVDALRYVLWTRGDDYVRVEPSDFYCDPATGRVPELLVRCTFDDLTPDEQARFLEWCSNESGTLRLHVCLRATLRKLPGGGQTVIPVYRSGKKGDGLSLDGDLREYLRSTYLKPLRDAERDLRSGRRSRLSRILGALPGMEAQSVPALPGQPATLIDVMNQANSDIQNNSAVKAVQDKVNDAYLKDLSFSGDLLTAKLDIGAKGSFEQLLERLELFLNPAPGHVERTLRGLGYNNLLFMAAELLLLQSHSDQVPCLLIEEPEAHLHPQHQTLFMQVLKSRTDPEINKETQVQVLLSTHSPQLAASADLDSLVMIVSHRAYPMTTGKTKLDADDYAFLRRFLDATKANLFFARGLILVEGSSENILLPSIAKKLGRDFSRHGVSIVNVGHRGLFRYSRIFQRSDGRPMPIPVALVTDRDIPPDSAKSLLKADRRTESEYKPEEIEAHAAALKKYDGGCVQTFHSPRWTLEFDLALEPAMASLIHQAVQIVKGTDGKAADDLARIARAEVLEWQKTKSAEDIAVRIFEPIYKKQVRKPMVAERLVDLIENLPDSPEDFRKKLPKYLVDAIEHVTPHHAVADSADQPASREAKAASA